MRPIRFTLRLALLVCASLAGPATAASVLTHLNAHDNTHPSDPIPGLGPLAGVVVSPDGAHVYAVSFEGALLLFARNAGTGVLTHVQTWFDDAGGIDGIGGARGMALSPDGASLYVAGEAVAVFARNAGTGLVTLVEAEPHPGLGRGTVAVSADGAHVYLGGTALVTYARDGTTGALTMVDSEAFAATDIAVSPDGQNVYGVDSANVTTYARDAGTGALTQVQVIHQPHHESIEIPPDGAYVYVGRFGVTVQNIRVFTRAPGTGTLADAPVGVGDIREVHLTPDGSFAVSADFQRVNAFSRNPATGALTLVDTLIQGLDGSGFEFVSAAAFSPDGVDLYVAAEFGITQVRLAAGTGLLSFVDRKVGTIGIRLTHALAQSADGSSVYAVGLQDAITTFDRDAVTGALDFRQVIFDFLGAEGLYKASGIIVSPDDAHVYVASPIGAVAAFSRDAGTGALTFVEVERDGVGGVDGIAGASSPAMSPDGAHLYVTGALDATTVGVATFARDAGTGALTFATTLAAPVSDVAVTPDGANVYGLGGVSITVFSREPSTGALAAIQTVSPISTGFLGRDLIVSPDGGQVYVTTDVGIRVYARDGGTGQLSLLETITGLDGAEELAIALRDLSMSSDGTRLVGSAANTGFANGGLLVYARDPGTGKLRFRQAQIAGPNGGPALESPFDLLLSPDGNHLYVGVADRVSTFGWISLCPPAPAVGCRAAGNASLRVADRATGRRDTLVFRWMHGGATSIEDYLDPIGGGTRYALCVYDQTGLLLESHALPSDTTPRPTWRTIGPPATPRGLTYRRRDGSPEGIKTMALRPGATGNASIVVRAKGALLLPPTPPLTTPVTAQLRSESGVCWGQSFATGIVNGTNGLFVAKTP